MIIEIGAGMAVAGSAIFAVTVRVHARRAIAAARGATKKAQDLAERFHGRLEAQSEIIGKLRGSTEILRRERDVARRALDEAIPVRGARGRFAKRETKQPLRCVGADVSGKSAKLAIIDEFSTLSNT